MSFRIAITPSFVLEISNVEVKGEERDGNIKQVNCQLNHDRVDLSRLNRLGDEEPRDVEANGDNHHEGGHDRSRHPNVSKTVDKHHL